jgi:aldehyde dehydrogenase (NAD+)
MTPSNYLNGSWEPSTSAETFERRNPADTRDLVGTYPESSEADVASAVAAARAALPAWRRLSPDARAQFLHKAAHILEERKAEIALAAWCCCATMPARGCASAAT